MSQTACYHNRRDVDLRFSDGVYTDDEDNNEDDPSPTPRSDLGRVRDVMAFLQQEINLEPENIRKWLRGRKRELLLSDQRYNKKREEFLGPDLASAHFICHRGGAVKFVGNDRWFYQREDGRTGLPRKWHKAIHVEAIDASNMLLIYEGFDNLMPLYRLQYLNLSGCIFIDDWCLSRLQRYKDTLLHLDISNCPNITERGLATLHHLTKLKKLSISNLPNVVCKQLVTLMLEDELPGCFIGGVDFSKEQIDKELAEVDNIVEQRQQMKKVEDVRLEYLERHVKGLKIWEKFVSYLPKTNRNSFFYKLFPVSDKRRETREL